MKKKWTIIFLISGENDLIYESISAINEIYSVGCGEKDEVNFVILFDGLKGERFSSAFARPSIYLARRDVSFMVDNPIRNPHGKKRKKNEDDLSNPRVLGKLLMSIKESFPAEHYGLFYKGHGGAAETDISNGKFVERVVEIPQDLTDEEIEDRFSGSNGSTLHGHIEYFGFSRNTSFKKLILLLYSNGTTKSLTYQKLADVLKKVFPKRLAFVCLDCCWGQQIENAYTFSSVTDNFIASADEMPALGLGYKHVCSHIIKRSDISATEISKMLVAVYYFVNYADYDSPQPEFREMGVSLTHVITNTETIDCFTVIFSDLISYLNDNLKRFFLTIKNARRVCLDYTYQNTDELDTEDIDYPIFNIDLIWFLENLKYFNGYLDLQLRDKIAVVLIYLQHNIIEGYLGNNYKRTVIGEPALAGKGITITFPKNADQASKSLLKPRKSKSKELVFYELTKWKTFINNYYKFEERLIKSTKRVANSLGTADVKYLAQMLEIKTNRKMEVAMKLKENITHPTEKELKSKWGQFYKFKKSV